MPGLKFDIIPALKSNLESNTETSFSWYYFNNFNSYLN